MSDTGNEEALATITHEDGVFKTPKERMSGARQLRALHDKCREDDRTSERNRAKVQDLKDYKPPLSKTLINQAGQRGRFNINFGEVATTCNEAISGYIDSYESPEHFVPIKINRGVVDETLKTQYERVMSDEYTKMVRGWDSGYFNYLEFVSQFVTHGLGIGYYMDRHTWQWEGGGLNKFKFPRRTKAKADAIEMCTCEESMGHARLSDIIQDEEVAKAAGWNISAVKSALASGEDELYDDEWAEEAQEKKKANDLDDVVGGTNPIKIIMGWVKEMDGSVSYYITTLHSKSSYSEGGEGSNDYLYKQLKAYKSFGEALQLFPFETGNNGNIYTIRGLGFMSYPQGVASNLMQCALLDSAKDSMSVKYIAPSEREIGSMPIVNAGPATFIPPHLQIVEKQYQPDLQRSAMPALEMLRTQMAAKSAASSTSSVFNSKQDRRSAQEVSAALEHFNSLNSAAMLLFFRPWRALLVESVRRAFVETQDDSQEYGRMAVEMQEACVSRGVPVEMFNEINLHETKTNIQVGAGSKAARGAKFEAGAQMYMNMDDAGRKNFDKDLAIHHFGVEGAKRYINFEDKPRELVDQSIATLETNDLLEGVWIEPTNSEVYVIHLRIHIQEMTEMIQFVENGQMELLAFTDKAETLYKHAQATLEMAVVPEDQREELNQFEQQLQQIGEYLNNGIREREKLQREQQEAEAQGQGQGGAEVAEKQAEAQAKQAETNTKIQLEQMKLQLKQAEAQLAVQKKQTENQLDAEKKSREIAHGDMLHKQKMVQAEAEALQKMRLEDAKTASAIKRKPSA